MPFPIARDDVTRRPSETEGLKAEAPAAARKKTAAEYFIVVLYDEHWASRFYRLLCDERKKCKEFSTQIGGTTRSRDLRATGHPEGAASTWWLAMHSVAIVGVAASPNNSWHGRKLMKPVTEQGHSFVFYHRIETSLPQLLDT
jgi:hypothetical protein